MASILILNSLYESIPLAMKLSQEDNICKVYSTGKVNYLKGSVNPSNISEPEKMVEQYDLVITTGPGYHHFSSLAQKAGKLFLGGFFCDKLLLDKSYSAGVIEMLQKEVKEETQEGRYPLSVTGWFFKGNLLTSSLNFDYTKFMERDRGVDTFQGLVTLPFKNSKLKDYTLNALTPLLTKLEFTGCITLYCLVTKDNCLWREFVPFINEVFYPFTELLKISAFDFLWKICRGKEISLREDEIAISCCLSLPPYPYPQSNAELIPVRDYIEVPPPALPHSHLLLNTLDGFLGFLTARGGSVNEARRRLYRTVNNSVLNNTVQYRSDIGLTFEDTLNKIKEWGWLDE